jgi:hypothetical protein
MQKPHFAVKILILSVCTVSKCYVHIQCPFSCCIQCDWNWILELVTRCFDTRVNPFVTRQSPQGKLNYVRIPSCIKGNAFIPKKYGVTVKPYIYIYIYIVISSQGLFHNGSLLHWTLNTQLLITVHNSSRNLTHVWQILELQRICLLSSSFGTGCLIQIPNYNQ